MAIGPPGNNRDGFDAYRQVKGQPERGPSADRQVQKGRGLGLSITKRFAECGAGRLRSGASGEGRTAAGTAEGEEEHE